MPKIKTKTASTKKVTTIKRWPSRDWLMFWLLVMANVALVAAIFGNVDVRTLKDQEKNATSSSQEISALKEQVDSLKNNLANTESQIVVDEEPGRACLPENPSKIDNYLSYTNEEQTLKLTIPFSTGWKNPDCTPLAPANIQSGSLIDFGPYLWIEGPKRDSSLVALPKMTPEQLKKEIAKQETADDIKRSEIQQRTVSGLTVYSYTTSYPEVRITTWYALGRNYTYRLTSLGWLTDAEAIKIIQSLRVTK